MKKIFSSKVAQYLITVFIGILFIFAGMYIWLPLAVIGFILLFVTAIY